MNDVTKYRKEYGLSNWFYTKGPFHAKWDLDLPRDNYNVTCAIPVDQLTEIERLCAEDELLIEKAEAAKAYLKWVRAAA